MTPSTFRLEPKNRARRRTWKGPGWTLFLADQRRVEVVER